MAVLLVALPACRNSSDSGQAGNSSQTSSTVKDKADINNALPEPLNSFVLDQASILTASEVDIINKKAAELDSLKLAQVAVVIVDDLAGMDVHDYAVALGNKWGVGHKETNDGITIVIKPKVGDVHDQKGQVAIATGTGMEKIITDEMCTIIATEKMVPQFKDNDYAGGINAALDEIKTILTKKH